MSIRFSKSNNPVIENNRQTLMIINKEQEERNVFYGKYAATLFGYIVSITKDKKQGEVILSKVFSEIFQDRNNYNLKKEGMLLLCIKTANRSINKMYQMDRKLITSIIFPTIGAMAYDSRQEKGNTL